MPILKRTSNRLVLVFISLIFDASALAQEQDGQVWNASFPEAWQSRVYESLLIGGQSPVVIATSPQGVIQVDQGGVKVLLPLKRGEGSIGESAILPRSLLSGNPDDLAIGVLTHNHHAIGEFRVVDIHGRERSRLRDSRHFHFRLAPGGQTFVGIDSHGKHAALRAEKVTYRFFNMGSPDPVAEIDSARPARNDSAYTHDGRGFIINSDESGLALYVAESGEPVLALPSGIRHYDAANLERLVVSMSGERSAFAVFVGRERVFSGDLKAHGGEGNVRNLAISNGGRLAVITDDRHALIYDLDRQDVTGQYQAEDELTINSVAVSDNGLVALGMQQADVKANASAIGRVVVVNASGAERFSRNTQHRRSNAWIPKVKFDHSGNRLLIETLESMTVLTVGK